MSKIPKIIHYCWFGGSELPQKARACIDSWKRYMPTYEIIEWNESNYDIGKCKYIKEAYEAKKWAFVSDYVRLDVIYQYGGIYLDTDVEIVRSFESLLENEAFIGFDDDNLLNTGMGFGAAPKNKIIEANKRVYEELTFKNEDGDYNMITCPYITSEVVKKFGGNLDNTFQKLDGITLYPRDYFCPLNYYTGKLNITNNTYSIHQYSMSWMSESDVKWHKFNMKLNSILGKKLSFVIVYGAKFLLTFIKDLIQKGPKYALIESRKKIKKI